MAKAELEFFDHDRNINWRQVEGGPQGIIEKILSLDPVTGSYTRLLKFPPGTRTSETLVHDFWEEVYILKGSLSDIAKKETYIEGMYACRPPGMKHGPYNIPDGCTTLEIRTYLPK
ncbi:MAG: cupin domain-containing protein [Acidobacteriaceae bacterium]